MSRLDQKQDIRKLSLEQLIRFFEDHGEKAFRGRQVYQWLWEKSARDFESMTNLSEAHRSLLDQNFAIRPIKIETSQTSVDRTIKSVFKLHDEHLIEGVLIPTPHRMTACVSSQVGCSLSCKFCATGYMERARNLEASEIYDQVVSIRKMAAESYQKPLTNIVFMGMGEPLLNYQNVLKAIDHITSPRGLGMASKRITVSTAGIAKMIRKLGDDQVKFNLALSLHAANDEKRSKIMPINESNSLKALESALIRVATESVLVFLAIVSVFGCLLAAVSFCDSVIAEGVLVVLGDCWSLPHRPTPIRPTIGKPNANTLTTNGRRFSSGLDMASS